MPKSSYQLWLALAFGFLAVDYHRIGQKAVADTIQDVSLRVDEDARKLVINNTLRSEISKILQLDDWHLFSLTSAEPT